MAFGTIFSLDSVAELGDPIDQIGEDVVWERLDAFFTAHNLLFQQAMERVAETTTDRMRFFGGVDEMVAQELDEFGSADAQKITPEGYNVGFPLRRFGFAIQWTRFAFETLSARHFAEQVNAITDADEQALYRQIKRAIFKPTNSTFLDRWELPTTELPIKALVNGDGHPIPLGPGGQTFDAATHTHYLGVATAGNMTQAELVAAMDHVTEHFTTGNLLVYINRAEEDLIRDETDFPDFKPYLDVRLVDRRQEVVADGTLDLFNHYDRAIGVLKGAEIWVKPWIPAGYVYVFLEGQPEPLVLRNPSTAPAGLRLMAEDERFPLRAREWEHRYGVGVWNRLNGAVIDTVTGGDTYTEPTI